MHLDPIRNAAANIANFFSAGIWPDQGVDDGTGLLMPALAGIAAGVTVALMLAIYFQTGYRSYRDMIRHGLAAAVGLSLLAFVVYDMRNAAPISSRRRSDPPPSSSCAGSKLPNAPKRWLPRWTGTPAPRWTGT
jgi:hypothetical protein